MLYTREVFRRRNQNTVIPQYEHTKIAGHLATYFGNEIFPRPDLEWNDFLLAVQNHDMGYGVPGKDIFEIGNITRDDREKLLKDCVSVDFGNVTAEILVKQHFLRLINNDEFLDFYLWLNEDVQSLIESSNVDTEQFNVADRIFDLLDAISFDFCWQADASDYTVKLFNSSNTETEVEFQIKDNVIRVNPWPFKLSAIEGAITAFDAGGYPDILNPRLVDYIVLPKK